MRTFDFNQSPLKVENITAIGPLEKVRSHRGNIPEMTEKRWFFSVAGGMLTTTHHTSHRRGKSFKFG